jgi:hypothetical protein
MSASSSNVSVSSCFEAAALCVGGPSIDCTPVVVRTENLRSRASTAAPESERDFPTPGAPLMTSALPAFLAPSRSDASSSTSSARPTSLPGRSNRSASPETPYSPARESCRGLAAVEGWPGDTPAGRSRPSNEPIRLFTSPREDVVPDAKASTTAGRSTPSCDQWLPREADVSARSTLRSGRNHATATAM